jgi:hypothetical protein
MPKATQGWLFIWLLALLFGAPTPDANSGMSKQDRHGAMATITAAQMQKAQLD